MTVSHSLSRLGLALALMAAACFAPISAWAETQVPQMTLSATGTASGAPDMAVVTVGVVGAGVDAQEAMTANSTQMQSVFDVLTDHGIAAEDITTSGLSLNPRYDHSNNSGKTPKVLGYIVQNQIAVTIHEVDEVGAVLDKMIKAGANAVQSVHFDIKDKSALESMARKDAAAKVQVIAQDYAAALGTDIVGIVSVSQNSHFPGPEMQMRKMAMESAVPVSADDVDVTVTLNVTYEISGALK